MRRPPDICRAVSLQGAISQAGAQCGCSASLLAADGGACYLLTADAVTVRVEAVRVGGPGAEVAVRNVGAAEVGRRRWHADVRVTDAVAVLRRLRRARNLRRCGEFRRDRR